MQGGIRGKGDVKLNPKSAATARMEMNIGYFNWVWGRTPYFPVSISYGPEKALTSWSLIGK